MASLLSPFNFGQKHAYFHARITIHELVNVPLVTGHFKARWRVKNVHGLQNIPGVPSSLSSAGEQGDDDGGERKSLRHKKSYASIASQETTSIKESGSPKTESQSHRDRKTSNRFLTGFKEAFKNRKPSGDDAESRRERESSATQETKEDEEELEDAAPLSASSLHSKDQSYDSQMSRRPKRTESFKSLATESDNASTHKRSSVISSRTKEETPTSMHSEPRGETMSERVREHSVKWERQLDVGLRIPIEKPKMQERTASGAAASGALAPSSNGPHGSGGESGLKAASSSAPSARSSFSQNRDGPSILRKQTSHRSLGEDARAGEGDSKSERHEREVREREKDRELVEAWGMLGSAELRINIKGEINTDASGHSNHSEAHVDLGYVSINLAEYAPYPESSTHQHLHHYHHHHHHHQHHQHHHHHHQHTLSRNETRRYLLTDSRTNATLKISIELTHMGGSKEYSVPAVRRGMVVGGMASLMNAGHKSQSSSTSSAGGSTDGHGAESGRHHMNGLGDNSHNASLSSLARNPLSSWPADSVARHARIPAANLKTELSHQDAARAIKEAGGQRMGFSFGAGAHHERPPEEIIEALFNPSSSSNAVLMLTPTVSRSEKVKGGPPTRRKGPEKQGKKEGRGDEISSREQSQRGVFPETPGHYGGLSPAEHPKDSSQSTGEPLSRFPASLRSNSQRPGPDMVRSQSSNLAQSSKPSSEASGESKSSHKRNTSGSTMRSILTNSSLTKIPQSATATATGNSGMTSTGSTSDSTQSNSQSNKPLGREASVSRSSSKPSLVHWDASVTSSERNTTNAEAGDGPPFSRGLEVPVPQWTASPSALSHQSANDELISPVDSIRADSNASTRETTASTDDDPLPPHEAFNPPATPPDVVRKEAILCAMTGKESHTGEEHKEGASRASRGLTKDEAWEQGYRGAGWGTLSLGSVPWAPLLADNADADGQASLSAYSSAAPSPTPGRTPVQS